MPSIRLTTESAYSPQQMFAIAADIERYPEFIKLITRATVSDQRLDDQGRDTFRSEITIVYPKLGIDQTFASRVIVDAENLNIRSVSNEKPMKNLDSRWQFRPLPDGGSAIDYSVDYEMASRMLQFVMNKTLDFAMGKVVKAFERRARMLYGRQPGAGHAHWAG